MTRLVPGSFPHRLLLGVALLCAAATETPAVEPLPTHPENPYRTHRAYASLYVFEVTTGTVLLEDHPEEPRAPASVVKMMTLLLLLEALDRGDVSLEDEIVVPWQSGKIGGSGVGLQNKERLSVADAAKALIISSGNDAAIAIAEHLAGSEAIFTTRMNRRARELGMLSTWYKNAHGLDGWGLTTSTTATDQARLVRELLRHPQTLEWTSVRSLTIRGGQTIHTTNKLLGRFPGLDGIKTGYTGKAGFCLASTAERDGFRVGCVLLGSPSSEDRFRETSWALTEAFLRYRLEVPIRKGEPVGPLLPIPDGLPGSIQPVATEDLPIVRPREGAPPLSIEVRPFRGLAAPIEAQSRVAHIEVLANGRLLTRSEAASDRSVLRTTWWDRVRSWFGRGPLAPGSR